LYKVKFFMEILVIGVIALAGIWLFSSGKGPTASIVVQSNDPLTSSPIPQRPNGIMWMQPQFGVATCGPALHTCRPSVSTVPVVASPSVADSTVNGVDQFAASGGITPTAAGGDVLFNSFVGTDSVTQYQYRRPNGDTYTTTVKNP
jgi:hypothetical protein